jgi:hypothetical protein
VIGVSGGTRRGPHGLAGHGKELQMADKKQGAAGSRAGAGNPKSSSKGGGKSTRRGAPVKDPAGNARLRGEDPSPDNRRRGEGSRADRA